MPPAPVTSLRRALPSTGAAFFLVLAVHALLFGRYRTEDMDDPWFLSRVRAYWTEDREVDSVFGASLPRGVEDFGKVHAAAAGTWHGLFGWSREAAHFFSLTCLLGSAAVWRGIALHLGAPPSEAKALALLFLAAEPFLSAGHSARPEAFVFLLCSLALAAWVRGRTFAAVLLSGLALESHPAGAAAFLFLGAAAASGPKGRAAATGAGGWARAAAGLAAAAALYLALHGFHPARVLAQAGETPGNFLVSFFFKTRYLRHLPELVLFTAGAAYLLSSSLRRRAGRAALAFLGAGILLTLLLPRPNHHYALYAYPGFLWTVLAAGRAAGLSARSIVGVLLLLLLPPSLWVAASHREFDLSARSAALREAVPDDGLPVAGSFNEWFAFRDRPYYSVNYLRDFGPPPEEAFYLVEEDDFRALPPRVREALREGYRWEGLGVREFGGEPYRLFRLERKPSRESNASAFWGQAWRAAKARSGPLGGGRLSRASTARAKPSAS